MVNSLLSSMVHLGPHVLKDFILSWRMRLKIGYGGSINLGGYGVELALKNMEYKAIDDSEVKKGDGGEDARTEDLSQDIRGFIFSKLLDRKPELTGELMTFRDHLLSSGVADTMNVWELKDLGYQSTQCIIRALEPLKLVQEINQNFPNLVSSLSRMQGSRRQRLEDGRKDTIHTGTE